jgi:hypothetical protein
MFAPFATSIERIRAALPHLRLIGAGLPIPFARLFANAAIGASRVLT